MGPAERKSKRILSSLLSKTIIWNEILTSVVTATFWSNFSWTWTSFNQQWSFFHVAEGWEQRNLKGDILHRKNDLDIDTINLLGLYEHISFYPLYVCAFLLPTLSLDCFYFICKFRLISLLQQRRGKKQSHNSLITAPSLILLPLTDNRRKKKQKKPLAFGTQTTVSAAVLLCDAETH